MERTGLVTFKGAPMTLVGNAVKAGDVAPDFTAVGIDLKPVKLSDFKGQVVIISGVPSLDTGICALQTKRFNKEASGLNAQILTVSMDLPFAARRFCADNSINGLLTLSDYMDRNFSHAYGLQLKEIGLVARSVIVIGKDGKVAYIELVPENTNEPNYEAALDAVRKLTA